MSRIIAFWSPSGAGSTSLLLNIASAMGHRHLAPLAVDLNLTTPSLALYSDLLPHDQPLSACLSRLLPALAGGRLTGEELARRLLSGPGFRLLAGMLDVVSASRLTEGQIRQLLRLLAVHHQLLLVDVTPALDSIGCLPILEMAEQIVLIAGPDLTSRFQTRRFALPLLGMGWQERTRLVLNRAGGFDPDRLAEEIGLPVAATIPELKLMESLIEAGQIAYDLRTLHPAAARYRNAIDALTGLLLRSEGE